MSGSNRQRLLPGPPPDDSLNRTRKERICHIRVCRRAGYFERDSASLNRARGLVYRPKMGALLYIVRDAIMLRDHGLVVVAEPASEGASLRVGDAVELRRVDGSTVVTEVKAFPMVNPYDCVREVPISFRPEVGKKDVPKGTEVWSYP